MDRTRKACRWLLAAIVRHAEALVAFTAFAVFSAGFWLAWPPLGLIVPGGIVLGSLTWKHLRGSDDA